MQLHPHMGSAVQVAFYNAPPEQLAEAHPVIGALLRVKCRPSNGCYTVPTERLSQAAGMSPSEVQRLCLNAAGPAHGVHAGVCTLHTLVVI